MDPLYILQAYQQNLYGPRYQWLFWHAILLFLNDQLSLGDAAIDGCDDAMVKAAMQGMIYFAPVSYVYQGTDETIGVSGYVSIHGQHPQGWGPP